MGNQQGLLDFFCLLYFYAPSPLKETGCNNKNPPKTYHVSRPVKKLIFQNATKNRGLSGSSVTCVPPKNQPKMDKNN